MAGKRGQKDQKDQKDQKKRFWSDEEKQSICDRTRGPGISVAQVARRHALNANLIHKWLREPRFASVDEAEDADAAFLPVEIEGKTYSASDPLAVPVLDAPLTAQRVDITLLDGRRILVDGSTSLTSVLALVEGLMP